MQNEGICHWDLHFSNILLSLPEQSESKGKTAFKFGDSVYLDNTAAKYIVKIIDFGRARQFKKNSKRDVSHCGLKRPVDAEDDNGNACTWKYPDQYCSATDVFSCLYWFWVFYFRKNSDSKFVSMFLLAFCFNRAILPSLDHVPIEHIDKAAQIIQTGKMDALLRLRISDELKISQEHVNQVLNANELSIQVK